jgi:methyl-accepting chemotaxis protein
MAIAAMWLQETDAISSGNAKLLMIFIGLVALALVTQAIVTLYIAIKAGKAIKELTETVAEFKGKALPLIDSAREIGAATQLLLNDTTPKVKAITDNLLDASEVVRDSAKRFDKTAADVNVRALRQVARVDGMVTAALTTTAEIAETIQHGIAVPARKIAVIATQAKATFEGLLAKAKSMAANGPFGSR